MKRIFLLILLLNGLNSFSQNIGKFKPGVKITENEKTSEYITPSSILFVFEGHTHMINNFLDLEKKIRKTFKKKMKKEFKNFKLDFNFNLNAEKSFKSDLSSIPSKKYNEKEYQAICYITLTDFKGWDNYLIEKRKQNYNLNIELKDIDFNKLMKLKLNVNSFNTIATQNKNSSKIIYKAIMENQKKLATTISIINNG